MVNRRVDEVSDTESLSLKLFLQSLLLLYCIRLR